VFSIQASQITNLAKARSVEPSQGFAANSEPSMKHFEGQYYHVYNRGCNRESIFVGDENYRFLLRQIKKFLPDSSVTLIAYCLMPNHYHFMIRSDLDNRVAKFIQRLLNSYAQAFNRQQQRTGTLFEGRAKSIWIEDESYLLQLCRYIHLNPVAAGLVVKPEDWQYSNYLEWIGKRNGTLVDLEFVRAYFPKPEIYAEFVQSATEEKASDKLSRYRIDGNAD
jgi:putative transposase